MMKSKNICTLIFTCFAIAGFTQDNNPGAAVNSAQYYQYQRDQAFNNYMKNVSSKGMAGSANSNFDYSIGKKALQEMADMWDKRAGKKTAEEIEAERVANRKKWEAEQREAMTYDAISDNRSLAYDEMKIPYIKMFQSVGFSKEEAQIFANKRIMEKRPTRNSGNGVLVYVDHPAGNLAYNAKKKYEEVKETAGFDELVFLIYDFSFTGYSAIKALEFLEKRFPEKKDVIKILKPLYGISPWRYFNEDYQEQSISRPGQTDYFFRFSWEQRGLFPVMGEYLFQWMDENPEELVSLFEDGSKYYHFDIQEYAINRKKFKELSRFIVNLAIRGKYNFQQKGKLMEDYRQYGFFVLEKEERQQYEQIKPFTWQDFEAVRNRYQVSGVKAMEFFGLIGSRYETDLITSFGPKFSWSDPLYGEELKRYADMGEVDARFLYAIQQMKKGNKSERQLGYEQILKLLEEGYEDAFKLDYDYNLKESLGLSNKNIKEYEELRRKHKIKK